MNVSVEVTINGKKFEYNIPDAVATGDFKQEPDETAGYLVTKKQLQELVTAAIDFGQKL